LNRARADDGDPNDEVVIGSELQLRKHRHLRPALHLEGAEHVGLPDHSVGTWVLDRDRREIVVDALMLGEKVHSLLHAGQHAERQNIHFHEFQGVDVVLKVVKELADSDPGRELRQIGIIDEDGRGVALTGKDNLGWAGHICGHSFIAMGNLLADKRVVDAIADEYRASAEEPFEERLIRGEQEEGQTSASILTSSRESYSRCDLRVDLHDVLYQSSNKSVI
jgi:hypothetical protein